MKLALIEMDLNFENEGFCINSCKRLLQLCSNKDIKIAFFPEMTLSGFSMNLPLLKKIYSNCEEYFTSLSRQYNISIGYGYVKIKDHKGRNQYKIQSITGETISYIKIHPFSYGEEDKYFEAGDSLYYIDIDDIKICPLICYDLRFPEIFQAASKTCHLITVAANWPAERQEHFITLLKARAIENQCYVAGINRTGIGNNLKYLGGSCIFDPMGNLIVPENIIKDDNNKILIYNISKEKVIAAQSSFPIKKDRKEDLYVKIGAIAQLP